MTLAIVPAVYRPGMKHIAFRRDDVCYSMLRYKRPNSVSTYLHRHSVREIHYQVPIIPPLYTVASDLEHPIEHCLFQNILVCSSIPVAATP